MAKLNCRYEHAADSTFTADTVATKILLQKRLYVAIYLETVVAINISTS